MASKPGDFAFDLSDAPPLRSGTCVAPTAADQRIGILDVLRGFALLGILVLNIESFSGPEALHDVPLGTAHAAFVSWHRPLDLTIFAVKWMFFEGKMRTLFALLYGAGIILLTERLERKHAAGRAADIFCRRNLFLLLFGVLHGTLIWSGDILSQYAMIASLLMFPFRHLAARRLIVLGLAIGIVGGTIGVTGMFDTEAVFAADRLRAEGRLAIAQYRIPSPAQAMLLAADAEARRQAPTRVAHKVAEGRLPYLQSVAPRANHYFDFVAKLFRTGFLLEVVGSMLLGMGLFKSGFLTAGLPRRLYAITALTGYAIALPIVLVGVVKSSMAGFSEVAVTRWMFLPYSVEVFAGAIANAALVILAFSSARFRMAFAALANVGRTAFSNYILTSLLCQFLFAWGPWKLYGALDYYQQLYVVGAVWAVNLLASMLWLRAFRYGPLEWFWRSLTYWAVQPIRR